MTPPDTMDRILASLHRAALDDAHWPPAAALIADAVGTIGNVLVVGEGTGDDERIYLARYQQRDQPRGDLVREYFDIHYPHDTGIQRLMGKANGQLVHIPDLYTEDERKKSPLYNEFLPRVGLHNGLYTRFDEADGLRMVWGVGDPTASGGWGVEQLALIEGLRPHVRHYLRVRQALNGAEATGGGLAALLDSRRIGVLHLERRGRVVAANAPALAILRHGDGLHDAGGTLRAEVAADDDRLQALLARALPAAGSRGPAGGSMAVRRASGGPRLGLYITPVDAARSAFGALRMAALVLLVDPADRPRIDPAWVAEALDLTPPEGRVASLIAEGRSVREAAAEAGVPETHVRRLLKGIYKKQGLSGQVDLVRRVAALEVLPGS